MIINMMAHPKKEHLKNQFSELLSCDKLSFGIVSQTKPDLKGSPLYCEMSSIQTTIFINEIPSYSSYTDKIKGKDIIIISSSASGNTYSIEENSKIVSVLHNGTTSTINISYCWNYVYNNEIADMTATLDSISEALSCISGIKATSSYSNNTIVVVGIDTILGIKLSTTSSEALSDRISLISFERITVSSGSCILPSGNKVTLSNDLIIYIDSTKFSSLKDASGKIYSIVLRYNLVSSSKGYDEFKNELDKNLVEDSTDNMISLELCDSKNGPDGDAICLAVMKPFESSLMIDSNKEKFSFLRPWYSPFDIKHRNEIGTGLITHNNPHGISFNDIDSDNTIHNQLLEGGIVLSKPQQIQNVCGEIKTYSISRYEVKADYDGSITGNEGIVNNNGKQFVRYFILPEIPISIISITNVNGSPIYYKWIEKTSILKVPEEHDVVDFIISYMYESTLSTSISSKSEGVSISGVRDNVTVLSEGHSLTTVANSVDFTDIGNLDKNYDVYVNKNGDIVKIPQTEASISLETTSDTFGDLVGRSRIEVAITDTPTKSKIDCPSTSNLFNLISYTSSKSYTLYQTYVLKKWDGTKEVNSLESMTNPNTLSVLNNDSTATSDVAAISIKKCDDKPIYDYFEKNNAGKIGANESIEGGIGRKIDIIKREDGYIYGGVIFKIILGRVDKTTVDSNITIKIFHRSIYGTTLTRVNVAGYDPSYAVNFAEEKNGIVSAYIYTEDFDKQLLSGIWSVEISGSSSSNAVISYLYFRWNLGKLDSNIYSKDSDNNYFKLSYTENSSNRVYTLGTGESKTPKTNDDFTVNISIIGTADGNSVTEELSFGSSYRDQKGLNTMITNNVFDTIEKYNITEASTTGKITMLSYPVGNVENLCGVFSAKYVDRKVKEIYDLRNVSSCIMQSANIEKLHKASSCAEQLMEFV